MPHVDVLPDSLTASPKNLSSFCHVRLGELISQQCRIPSANLAHRCRVTYLPLRQSGSSQHFGKVNRRGHERIVTVVTILVNTLNEIFMFTFFFVVVMHCAAGRLP